MNLYGLISNDVTNWTDYLGLKVSITIGNRETKNDLNDLKNAGPLVYYPGAKPQLIRKEATGIVTFRYDINVECACRDASNPDNGGAIEKYYSLVGVDVKVVATIHVLGVENYTNQGHYDWAVRTESEHALIIEHYHTKHKQKAEQYLANGLTNAQSKFRSSFKLADCIKVGEEAASDALKSTAKNAAKNSSDFDKIAVKRHHNWEIFNGMSAEEKEKWWKYINKYILTM